VIVAVDQSHFRVARRRFPDRVGMSQNVPQCPLLADEIRGQARSSRGQNKAVSAAKSFFAKGLQAFNA
jgi:hypothetical protein